MFQVLLYPCGYKTCGWQVKLCDSIKHGALLERSEDLYQIIKCAVQVLLLHYITIEKWTEERSPSRVTEFDRVNVTYVGQKNYVPFDAD